MPDEYEYDVFISYRRVSPTNDWVHNHLYPRLSEWLPTELPPNHNCKIFIDSSIETGSAWPERLRLALRTSRCLVAVWSPQYFSSAWCLAEWQTLLERERMLGLRTEENPSGLIYPVVFSDGQHFPEEANAIQQKDLRAFNIPWVVYRDTPRYVEFTEQIKTVAAELATMVQSAPPWADWPVVTPAVPAKRPIAKLPRI